MPVFCTKCGGQNPELAKFCLACGEELEYLAKGTSFIKQASTAKLTVPTILDNRYEIISIIKSGAMGCVFKAKDTRLDNIVAVKQMLSAFTNPQDTQYAETRFKEEAKMLSTLRHQGLPKVFDFFIEKEPSTGKSLHYLVMEFIEGKDLETIIHERGQKPFPVDEAVDYFRQILDILHYLHTQNPPIVYRDLNPRNVMVQKGKVFIVDFGIARLFNPQQKGTAIGTVGYAAPEQYKGAAEPRSDIFSLGAVMHYLVTGKNPEDKQSNLFCFEQCRKTNPSVPEYLDTLIMSMVDIVSDKRPQSAEKIQNILKAQPPIKPQITLPPPAISSSQSTRKTPVPIPSSAIPKISLATHVKVTQASAYSKVSSPLPMGLSTLMKAAVVIFILLITGWGINYVAQWRSIPAPLSSETPLMVLIPAGEFLMGSPKGFGSDDDECPQHRVYLDAYYISKYEVTNEQFSRFVSSANYKAEGSWKDYAKAGKEKHPVVNVTWNDAMAYCRWEGGSLPTEAQWEKAARGTDGREYPWGNTWDGSMCNWRNGPKVAGMADMYRRTTPGGSFPSDASPYGIYDMAGNVGEWCADWYDKNYYKSSPSRKPEGGKSGQSRVIRGGSWAIDSTDVFRCANRLRLKPGNSTNLLIGFRVCRSSNTP